MISLELDSVVGLREGHAVESNLDHGYDCVLSRSVVERGFERETAQIEAQSIYTVSKHRGHLVILKMV